jgi:hypothetical protein
MPIVEADLSRMSAYFQNNFKATERYKKDSFILVEPEEVFETTQNHLDEFLRLIKEFECEFEIVRKIVGEIKPITFLDDDSFFEHWNNNLVGISWGYTTIINLFNRRKIYIKL